MRRLHLGCGNEILQGWTNHDIAALPGVDVVHDLTEFPWPFDDNSFDEIRLFHVLEHLPETIRTIEEIHRILAPEGRVIVRVPYWNSPDMGTDPTHKASFNEHTFEYFDPSERHCQERPYYSTARFRTAEKHYWTKWRRKYRRVSSSRWKRLLEFGATYLGGVIWVLEVELVALKHTPETVREVS